MNFENMVQVLVLMYRKEAVFGSNVLSSGHAYTRNGVRHNYTWGNKVSHDLKDRTCDLVNIFGQNSLAR